MAVLLYWLAGGLVLLGVFGAIGLWPERSQPSAWEVALPLGTLLNMVIMAAALAGLGVLIQRVEGIARDLSRVVKGAQPARSRASTGGAAAGQPAPGDPVSGQVSGRASGGDSGPDAGQVSGQVSGPVSGRSGSGPPDWPGEIPLAQLDGQGLTPDGRVQVLDTFRCRQLDDGDWRVETLDGRPHPEVPGSFSNLGTAKRAARAVV